MKILFASYVFTKEFDNPDAWLIRIAAYAGIQSALAVYDEVISIEQIEYEGTCDKNGVSYHFIKLTRFERYFPLKLHRYIIAQEPDVVVIQGLHFPMQVIQLGMMLNKKIKIIVHHHAEKPLVGIKKRLQQIADHYIDAYLFSSMAIGADWVKSGNITSLNKIHEIMEVSSIFYPVKKAAAKLKTGVHSRNVFLWVGRLNANKDPLNVIRAFLKFTKTNPDARLYMIYHTEELLHKINALLNEQNKGNITLIGRVPHHELLYWFNSADFFISGSYYEGSGTAVCEAMSCGCIPLVTDIPAFRTMTDNGDCGMLYQAGNEDELLLLLEKTKTIDREEKRKKAIAYYKSNLSFEAIAKRIHTIAASI